MLTHYEIPHQVIELRDDFKQVRRASIKAQCKFTRPFNLRADYPGQALEITCRNIGALDRRRYSIPAASLEVSVLEEFTKMLLGYLAPALDVFADLGGTLKPLVQAVPGDVMPAALGGSASPSYAIEETICSGVIGMARTRTPMALKTALPIAAPTGPCAASPAPTEG